MSYKPALDLRLEPSTQKRVALTASVYESLDKPVVLFRSLPYDPVQDAFRLTKRIDTLLEYFKTEGFEARYVTDIPGV